MENHKQYIFKIVLTGPESSGKTTLAEALAGALHTVCVPEFARSFLAHLGRPYLREDLRLIGRGQEAWEKWYNGSAGKALVCDTDWTVLQIWEHYRFGFPASGAWEWQKGYIQPRPADLYLLCAPDFPWEPDPLREHPAERGILFSWYQRLLMDSGAKFEVLYGRPEDRLEQAISVTHKFFRTL